MINTYRYGGKGKKIEDGEEVEIQIPPHAILNRMGAFLKVTIAHPTAIQKEFEANGKTAPVISVNALIDTGASGTVITPKIAEELGLVHTGYQNVTSVQDEQKRPVFYGFITFPWGSGKEMPMVSCPLKQFDCLIGRDILMHWHFTYNGPDGSIVICD